MRKMPPSLMALRYQIKLRDYFLIVNCINLQQLTQILKKIFYCIQIDSNDGLISHLITLR